LGKVVVKNDRGIFLGLVRVKYIIKSFVDIQNAISLDGISI